MMHDPSLALAADYSDALVTARRAKNVLVLLILLMLLGQLALFFTAKYSHYDLGQAPPASATAAAANTAAANIGATAASALPTTLQADASSLAASSVVTPGGPATPVPTRIVDVLQYCVGVTGFLGITLSIVLAIVVFLLTMIMLVGRLVGVHRVTSAFIWSIVLIVLLFPWQAFLAEWDFKIPGVLYTWGELVKFAKVGVGGDSNGNAPTIWVLILHWSRFVAFPLVTVIITLMIQVKSNRGLREALGEVDAIAAAPIV